MKIHKHNVGNEGAKPRHHEPARSNSWKAHRDWRVWIAVLMIVLILGYVLTDSLALQPSESVTQPMPATDAP